jgi:O-antigen/teichoic acid export membrane protein
MSFALAVFGVWLLHRGNPLLWLMLSFAFGELVTLILLARHHSLYGGNWRAPNRLVESFKLTQWRSAPFAANGFLILVYNRLDVAIVAALASTVQAGIYAPASRIQDALMIGPMTIIAALAPVAAREFGQNRNIRAVKRPLAISILLSLIFAVPIAVGVAVFAPRIVQVVLGPHYVDAVVPIQVLAMSIPFIAVGAPVSAALVAIDRPGASTAMIGAGFVVAVGGMILLTPRYGAVGAAWAGMLREPVIAAIGLLCLAKYYSQSTSGSQ